MEVLDLQKVAMAIDASLLRDGYALLHTAATAGGKGALTVRLQSTGAFPYNP